MNLSKTNQLGIIALGLALLLWTKAYAVGWPAAEWAAVAVFWLGTALLLLDSYIDHLVYRLRTRRYRRYAKENAPENWEQDNPFK